MYSHIMKTTIEVADDLFLRAQRQAQKEGTTFRALTEEGLRLALQRRQESKMAKLTPLVTVRGRGLAPEFQDAAWERIRDEIHPVSRP
jgi:hypothetical protein